jgi:hypothetical protein
MARKKITRTPNSVNISGELGTALAYHAAQRMRHLFLFMFAVDAACKLVNAALNTQAKPASMIQEAATHQVDSGLRASSSIKDVFDEDDINVVKLPSTAFNRIDAAHYCNLGLISSTWNHLTNLAETLTDDYAVSFIEDAEIYTSNTVWLPQRVNIGPDRIIDQLHYALAKKYFGDGKPIFSATRMLEYAQEATNAIGLYKVVALSDKKYGLAACCDWYLQAYSKQSLEALYKIIGGNISADCSARKLTESDYIGT